LVIEPVEKLVNLFDSNFEYFHTFFDTFLPSAFVASLARNREDNVTNIFLDHRDFNFNATASDELKAAFTPKQEESTGTSVTIAASQDEASLPPPKTVSADITKMEKAQWYWKVANFSLVVPVILALLVLYHSCQKIDDVVKTQNEALKNVTEKYEKTVNHYQEALKRYERIEKILIDKTLKDLGLLNTDNQQTTEPKPNKPEPQTKSNTGSQQK